MKFPKMLFYNCISLQVNTMREGEGERERSGEVRGERERERKEVEKID